MFCNRSAQLLASLYESTVAVMSQNNDKGLKVEAKRFDTHVKINGNCSVFFVIVDLESTRLNRGVESTMIV